MKRLVLGLATALLASIQPVDASATRCFESSADRSACVVNGATGEPRRAHTAIAFRDGGGGAPGRGPSAAFESMIPRMPSQAETYFLRARAHFDSGEYDRAIANYDTAIGLRPDAAGAYVNRGSAYARKGELARAMADFDTAIRLKPNLASAYLNRGIVSRQRGLTEWALRDFGRAYLLNLRPRWMVETLDRYGRLP